MATQSPAQGDRLGAASLPASPLTSVPWINGGAPSTAGGSAVDTPDLLADDAADVLPLPRCAAHALYNILQPAGPYQHCGCIVSVRLLE